MKVFGAACGSPTLRSNDNKNIIDFISRALYVKAVKSMSRPARLFFFFPPFTVSMQTLSEKNNIKIGVSIQPHLSCSLAELIYHCVYSAPHGSLFMLRQKKRRRRREVLTTVFVCHRVPFLIPQAPAMPGGAASGGGSAAQSTPPSFLPAALKVAWGDGLRGGPLDPLYPGHPAASERRTFPA